MFFKRKKAPSFTFDVTKKRVKTWWGGTKLVPTTRSEQKKLKKLILERHPDAVILDSKAKRERDLEWIDRVEDFNAFMDD